MNTTTTFDLAQFGPVVAGLLIIGTVLKGYTPINTRLIPPILLAIGVIAYMAITRAWGDIIQWFLALSVVANAVGIHSGVKNTIETKEHDETTLNADMQRDLDRLR
ncbi:MAG TPA: hypothetical protein PLK78_16905 [Verrucomicrobiota bacterium]|nr:hypothetical protein [Verrucomicrobiota bacterium]